MKCECGGGVVMIIPMEGRGESLVFVCCLSNSLPFKECIAYDVHKMFDCQ